MTAEAILGQQGGPAPFRVANHVTKEPLGECVRDALESYFKQLDGHTAADLYQMVIAEVERPLFASVMQHTQGNQTRAAQVLGISRSTLRKKLARYQLD